MFGYAAALLRHRSDVNPPATTGIARQAEQWANESNDKRGALFIYLSDREPGKRYAYIARRSEYPDFIELGQRVKDALVQENRDYPAGTIYEPRRTDAVVSRAVQAQSAVGFLDFLERIGELELAGVAPQD